jgi:NADH-quinone oxidoreductase subunit N
MTDVETIKLLLPEIILVAMATWVFVGGAFSPGRLGWVCMSIAGVAVAGYALFRQGETLGLYGSTLALVPSGPLFVDWFAHAARWAALGTGGVVILASSRSGGRGQDGEFLGSVLLVAAGLMIVASAADLVLLFAGLELISIPTYVLLLIGRRDRGSAEAGMKYFFLSVISSTLLLYGFSFLYGVAGSTHLPAIQQALAATGGEPGGAAPPILSAVAAVLVFAGLGFKIAIVPFHFYAPDVYQGTTSGNAALLAVVPKIAGLVALVRLVAVAMPGLEAFGWQLSLTLALVTMTVGNVTALWQNNARRMLAYSSIAQAGYMLIGLAVALAGHRAGGFGGLAAMFLYVTVYATATLGAFAALVHLGTAERDVGSIDELAGAARVRPAVAAALAVCMFSLTGLPPLAGFWGKFELLYAALRFGLDGSTSLALGGWFVVLVIVTVINAAISAAYYLRVVAVMYFGEPSPSLRATGGAGPAIAAMACSALLVALGFLPAALMAATRHAELSLRPAAVVSAESPLAPGVAPAATLASEFGAGRPAD